MKTRKLVALVLVVMVAGAVAVSFAAKGPHEDARTKAFRAYKNGNYRDAYQLYRKILLDEDSDPMQVGGDLDVALQCLRHLNRVDEVDAFREAVIKVHDDNWRLLHAAAKTYAGQKVNTNCPRWSRIPSWGYRIAGEYHRGRHRGGGKVVNSMARDRVRAMQLMTAAMKEAKDEKNTKAVAQFHLDFARMIRVYRGYSQAWRLQYKTDLDELPDYDDGRGYYYYYHNRNKGAPVGPDGEPVYYSVPESWEAAANDGERWRFLLLQAKELDPGLANQVRMIRADFLHGQFGCQTMRSYGWYFRRSPAGDDKEKAGGILQLHTLKQTETIAKLATGIKRFELPDEHNFIKIYRQVVAAGKTSYGEQALGKLAQLFENRRQYETAAETWRENIKTYGPGNRNWKKKRLSQIVDPWGMFEHKMQQPAGGGAGATVPFRFRNGEKVTFTAHAVKVETLLDDVKAYIRKKPNRLDWQKVQIRNLGYRLVTKNQKKYVGEQVAQWSLDLEPRPHHFDKRMTVTTPLQDPGAYLLRAQMKGGNTCYIVLWLNDTVIVKKHLDQAVYIYVADSVTGKPVPKANVEFFGYRQKYTGGRNYRIDIENFARHTDADGQIILNKKDMPPHYRWILIARTDGGRFAHHGYTSVWYGSYHDPEYKRTRTFIITDRPVYRPEHTVKFKMWIRHAQYDMGDASHFAGKTYIVRINDAKGEKVFEKKITTDEYGGLDGSYKLPDGAALGRYYLSLWRDPDHRIGGNAFRVEEYKKPEFEVTVDAPTEPVMLGEKITATVKAKYYFGAAVTKAKVKYKVERRDYDARWYPVMYWDWFYEPGYWWFAYDYAWYPGWGRWGCKAPRWWWYGTRQSPPELVSENEVEIGPDGTVEVEIDTSIAKEVHGDTDHKYTITAEVTDQSRRTIVGTGNVMVARKPFEVYAWVDRGHYRVGDTIHASFNAQTLSKQPVKGDGELTLYSLTYNEKGEPTEKKVQSWELDTNPEGRAEKKLAAHKPGQYRLSYKVTDAKDHTIEGGYIFIITGEGFDGSDFRFNAVELVPDKKEYEPGEKVQLRVNTNRLGSTVLLFTRPTNGIYLKPEVLRLDGKSVEQQIAVTKKDMPNFFVEAVTISGGDLHTAVREIIVPPEKRVLKVEAKPSKSECKPGEEAEIDLTVTDIDGDPFVGSLALTVYDKSVEYISGGSNVPEIKAFFWKWRRRHHPRTESSLQRGGGNLTPPKKPGMSFLGVFGRSVADMPQQPTEGGERESRDGAVREEKAKGRQLGAAPAAKNARRKADRGVAFAADKEAAGEAGGGRGEAEKVEPTVRKKFADTALWVANLTTDKDGTATVDLTMPENLTGWKIKVWAMGHGTKVG
ncbi:MAG: MG2 domain-containing protein, partial [Planctomycetota bacterium]